MSGICRAAGTLGGIVTVPGAMAGTLEGTTSGGVKGTGTEIDAGVVITGNGRLRAGLTVEEAGAKGLEVSHSQSGMSTVE